MRFLLRSGAPAWLKSELVTGVNSRYIPTGVPRTQHDAIQKAVSCIVQNVGEDPTRDGLLRTPRRAADAWLALTAGYRMDLGTIVNDALFDVEHNGGLVVVRDINVFSLCEHHLLPFYGRAHVAYKPAAGARVIGLSKLARIVDLYARRFQVQERLTAQVADALLDVLKADGVAVWIDATHTCMTMRGAAQPSASTITTALRGSFASDAAARAEVMSIFQSGTTQGAQGGQGAPAAAAVISSTSTGCCVGGPVAASADGSADPVSASSQSTPRTLETAQLALRAAAIAQHSPALASNPPSIASFFRPFGAQPASLPSVRSPRRRRRSSSSSPSLKSVPSTHVSSDSSSSTPSPSQVPSSSPSSSPSPPSPSLHRKRRVTLIVAKQAHKFAAGHFTLLGPTSRERLHGHDHSVVCRFSGAIASDGLLVDYNILKTAIKAVCDVFDEKVLVPAATNRVSVRDYVAQAEGALCDDELSKPSEPVASSASSATSSASSSTSSPASASSSSSASSPASSSTTSPASSPPPRLVFTPPAGHPTRMLAVTSCGTTLHLPAAEVLLLPIPNVSVEALAGLFLDTLHAYLRAYGSDVLQTLTKISVAVETGPGQAAECVWRAARRRRKAVGVHVRKPCPPQGVMPAV